MKTAVLVARILLGLIFVVFGLNGFFLFITPPEHTPAGNAFINLLVTTGFMYVEKSFEIIGGALLLLDLYVPLGLAILASLVVSILSFHLLMERNTLAIGVIPFLLWGFLTWVYRKHFASLLVRRADARGRHHA
jgi:putative oxidoreductase